MPMRHTTLLHWPQDAAHAKSVLQQGHTVVLCLLHPVQADRPAARQAVRTALQVALGHWLECPPSAVQLHSQPGEPVRIHHPATPVALSISHETDFSVAAIAPNGSVGVDLVRTTVLPDATECLRLAHEYLGPSAREQLAKTPEAERPLAFARAWTAWEARLKCAGVGLREWEPALEQPLCQLETQILSLPGPYCGTLAWGPHPAPLGPASSSPLVGPGPKPTVAHGRRPAPSDGASRPARHVRPPSPTPACSRGAP